MRRFTLTILLLSVCPCLYAQVHTVSGIVFNDKNANGIFDAREKGIRGIPVSNGDTIIFTSKGGSFAMETVDGCGVFPVLPSGYTITGNNIGSAALKGKPENGKLYFPLVRQKIQKQFRIAAVGDVQVKDSTELSYAARTIFSELSNRSDIDLAIYLGDLVNDNMELLAATAELLDRMPHQSWTVLGNHDLDKGSQRLPVSYKRIFGPADYAFNYGHTLFIVLDNVSGYGSSGYTGRLSERQKRFTANCLAITPENYNIVLCVHTPVYKNKYRDETIALFGDRKNVLIISGHTHRTTRHVLADNICELGAGASCGSWWTGEIGPDAMPLALQQCGAPRNYYIVDFYKDGYSLRFKGVGMDVNTAMDVWIKGEEHNDAFIPELSELPEGCVVANIYGGAEVTDVRIRFDGGAWQEMEYSPMQAPAVSRLRFWNKTAGHPTGYNRRTPFNSSASPHIWSCLLPEGMPSGAHEIEIHAADGYGFEASCKREFIKR